MKKSDLVTYRMPQPSDIPFIYATWLKGLRYGNPTFRAMPARIYYRVYHDVITAILTAPDTYITVACLKEDPETILGYSVGQGTTLHWMFVKKPWRGIGLGYDLMPAIERVSHLTEQVAKSLGPIYEPHPLPEELQQFIRENKV